MSPSIVIVCARASNSGKTTWICALLGALTGRGLRVGTVKHTHKDFDVPGKDSTRHRDAGAERVVLSAPNGRSVLIPMEEPPLSTIVAEALSDMDIVLAEGFRNASETIPRILVTDASSDAADYSNVVQTVPRITGPPADAEVEALVEVILSLYKQTRSP